MCCLVFFLDAIKAFVQWCIMMCSETKHASLMCSVQLLNSVCLVRSVGQSDQCRREPTCQASIFISAEGGKRPLKQASVPLVSLDTCRRRDWLGAEFVITDNMMCAGYEQGGVDTCQVGQSPSHISTVSECCYCILAAYELLAWLLTVSPCCAESRLTHDDIRGSFSPSSSIHRFPYHTQQNTW